MTFTFITLFSLVLSMNGVVSLPVQTAEFGDQPYTLSGGTNINIAERWSSNDQPIHNSAISLRQEGGSWYGKISVAGDTEYEVIMDTGSSDLWVSKDQVYPDPRKGIQSVGTLSIGYVDGSGAQGNVYLTNVTIAGLVSANMPVTLQAELTKMDETKGIVGLAYPNSTQADCISSPNSENLCHTDSLMGQLGHQTSGRFSFSYTHGQAEMYLDGHNSEICNEDFVWKDVLPDAYDDKDQPVYGFFEIEIDALTSGTQVLLGKQIALIDTGTTNIAGPSHLVDQFYGNLSSTFRNMTIQLRSDPNTNVGYFWVPCEGGEDVSLVISEGDTERYLTIPWNIFTGYTEANPPGDMCRAMIQRSDQDHWIVGHRALQNWYTTFDYFGHRIGFASLKES